MQGVLLFPGLSGGSVLPIMPIILPITPVKPARWLVDLLDVSGSIRQRGPSSWELRVYSGLDPDSGKRRYRTATVVGNRSDAERGLAELVASVRSERSIGSASTVSELLDAWFVVASGSWAPTTIRQTRSVVDRYLHPQLGSIRVGELTPSVIDAAYVRLRLSGGGRGQGLSSGTLARVHVVLRSALAQAQRWGWIFDNPVERAHRIKVRKTERKPPTPDEAATLIDGSPSTICCCICLLRWPCPPVLVVRNFSQLVGRTLILSVVVSRLLAAGSKDRTALSCRTRRRRVVIKCRSIRSRVSCYGSGLVMVDVGTCSVMMAVCPRGSRTGRRSRFCGRLTVLGFAGFDCTISGISWRRNCCRRVLRWRLCRNGLIINGSRPSLTSTLTPSRRATPTPQT
jgi:Phage integrase, N-terminal SAM-like domain